MARQEIFKMHLCAPYGIPATGSCHSQLHQHIAVKKWVVLKNLHINKKKISILTFLTTPGTSTFHEAVPDCFIVLIFLSAQGLTQLASRFSVAKETTYFCGILEHAT